jgi:hypothetical protein
MNRKQRRMSQIHPGKTGTPAPGPKMIQVDPKTLPLVACPECGGVVFIQAERIRKMSAIISPSGRVQYAHEPVPVCLKCYSVLPPTP